MFKNKKVIIFDLDGTLIDSIGVWNMVDYKMIKNITGKSYDNETLQKNRDEALKKFNNKKNPYVEYCRFLSETYNFGMSAEETHEYRNKVSRELLEKAVDYKEKAPEFIKLAKEKGFILAIGTTTKTENFQIYMHKNKNLIEKAPIQNYFSLICTRNDVKNIKPDPEVFLMIKDKLNVTKDECIIIEDSLVGVEAAENAGIDCIAIYDKYSEYQMDLIKEKATYFVKDYDELIKQLL